MTKEGTPLSAAERIIAWQKDTPRREAEEEARAKAEKLAREQVLLSKIHEVEAEFAQRNRFFEQKVEQLNLRRTLEEINERALEGKGEVFLRFPYNLRRAISGDLNFYYTVYGASGKPLDSNDTNEGISLNEYHWENPLKVPVEKAAISVSLRWGVKGLGAGNRITIEIGGDDTVAILAGTKSYPSVLPFDSTFIKFRDESACSSLAGEGFSKTLSLSDPRFDGIFNSSLVEAFQKSRWWKVETYEVYN